LLKDSGILDDFWLEALEVAIYIENRTGININKEKVTAEEA